MEEEMIIVEQRKVPQWLIDQLKGEGKFRLAEDLERERKTWIGRTKKQTRKPQHWTL